MKYIILTNILGGKSFSCIPLPPARGNSVSTIGRSRLKITFVNNNLVEMIINLLESSDISLGLDTNHVNPIKEYYY